MSLTIATARRFQPAVYEPLLLRCVLASLALHALVLFGFTHGGEPAPPAKALPVLTATLAPSAAAPPRASVEPSQPEPVATQPPAPPRPAATPTASRQKPAPADTANAATPEPAPTVPGSAVAPATPAAPAEARPARQAPAATPSGEATAKAGTDADAGTLEQYRLALIVATRLYKRYPAIAMAKGWQGRVDVHMVIGANGMVASASIKSGSGHEILDSQALDMIRKGKTAVPIPAGLRGREFSIDVPVIFNLDSPNS